MLSCVVLEREVWKVVSEAAAPCSHGGRAKADPAGLRKVTSGTWAFCGSQGVLGELSERAPGFAFDCQLGAAFSKQEDSVRCGEFPL